jgi:hypothetical protein
MSMCCPPDSNVGKAALKWNLYKKSLPEIGEKSGRNAHGFRSPNANHSSRLQLRSQIRFLKKITSLRCLINRLRSTYVRGCVVFRIPATSGQILHTGTTQAIKNFNGQRQNFNGQCQNFDGERNDFNGQRQNFNGQRKDFNSQR